MARSVGVALVQHHSTQGVAEIRNACILVAVHAEGALEEDLRG